MKIDKFSLPGRDMKISNLGTKISTALLTGSAVLATTGTAHAQTFNARNISAIPIFGGGSITGLISSIINVALALIGIVAVIYLIWGGITYITAGGDAEKAGKGRIAITNAIIGIIIIIAALVIYNAVLSAGTGGGLT